MFVQTGTYRLPPVCNLGIQSGTRGRSRSVTSLAKADILLSSRLIPCRSTRRPFATDAVLPFGPSRLKRRAAVSKRLASHDKVASVRCRTSKSMSRTFRETPSSVGLLSCDDFCDQSHAATPQSSWRFELPPRCRGHSLRSPRFRVSFESEVTKGINKVTFPPKLRGPATRSHGLSASATRDSRASSGSTGVFKSKTACFGRPSLLTCNPLAFCK